MNELYLWIGFHAFLFVALALDLGAFQKNKIEVSFSNALKWCAFWILSATLFGLVLLQQKGLTAGVEFLSGYFIEWSLSVDNLFVFFALFSSFSVSNKNQHRILFWGVLSAIVFRATFIILGIQILDRVSWIIYVFGVFLLWIGFKIGFFNQDEQRTKEIGDYQCIQILKKIIPIAESRVDGSAENFFVKKNKKIFATHLFLILFLVEITDLIFASDSIPAVLAVTKDPMIAYTSNIFAILGLRSLYFAIVGLMVSFAHLRFSLAAILIFVGGKMCLSHWVDLSPVVSLVVIVGLLLLGLIRTLMK